MTAPYCPLPLTDSRRAYVNSHDTDISRTLEEHAPIRVSEVTRIGHKPTNFGHGVRDDYDLVQSHDWLDLGAFK